MRDPDYDCPICGIELTYYSRHPNYICNSCASEATDENGRALNFFNTNVAGGFMATYVDTNEESRGHECFVRGRKCYADEAHMGGIVIEVVTSPSR